VQKYISIEMIGTRLLTLVKFARLHYAASKNNIVHGFWINGAI